MVRPASRIAPTRVNVSVAGSKISANDVATRSRVDPPVIRTRPSPSLAAACIALGSFIEPTWVKVPVAGSKISADTSLVSVPSVSVLTRQ